MNTLCIDIGGTAMKSAQFSEHTMTGSKEHACDGRLGKKHLLDNLYQVIDSYSAFDAIGISTTGQVDPNAGTILYANQNVPDYTGTPLKQLLEEKYHVPVAVQNDVNAAALGEAYYGSGQKEKDFLCVTYGTGVGGAIIMNRQIYTGCNYIAGEFGHILTHPEGRLCGCGHHGCYEMYASTTALVHTVSAQFSNLTNGRAIFAELSAGNASVKAMIDEWILEVIYGLVSLIHTFNPSCIVLGGGIMSQPYIIQEIERRIPEYLMERFRSVKLVPASLGNQAGVYGMLATLSNMPQSFNHPCVQ